jgi:uncharacterized protein (TIGR02391 family)
MARRLLDEKLVEKLAKKRVVDALAIGKLVSKAAHKHGISSQAALVVLAKQHGIGTAAFQRRLDVATNNHIREVSSSGSNSSTAKKAASTRRAPRRGTTDTTMWSAAINALILDLSLRERCGDILRGRSNFDRAVNQATQVLEDRIRRKLGGGVRLTGEPLVGFAFNEEISKSKLRIASQVADEQRGFTQILRGMVPGFRNATHHHVTDAFSREDALRICGFVDFLLRVVDGADSASPELQTGKSS